MTIFGVDTSSAIASVALTKDGTLVGEVTQGGSEADSEGSASVARRTNHAAVLVPLIQSLLVNTGVAWQQISALAVSIGPGSFTGLRIGLSTVKGLAYGWDVPLVGIPTLLAIASRVQGWQGLICPILDARKKEVYAALFRSDAAGKLLRLTEDAVCSPDTVLEKGDQWAPEPCVFIGDGTGVYGDIIRSRWGERAVFGSEKSYPSTAHAVARLAAERVEKKDFDAPGLLTPVYLRPSEAELKKNIG